MSIRTWLRFDKAKKKVVVPQTPLKPVAKLGGPPTPAPKPTAPAKPSSIASLPAVVPPWKQSGQMQLPLKVMPSMGPAQPVGGGPPKTVQHPGIRGGKGYYTPRGDWRYGEQTRPRGKLRDDFPDTLKGMQFERELPNGDHVLSHPQTKQRYVVSSYPKHDPKHADEHMTADHILRALGHNVPRAQTYETKDAVYHLAEAVKGARTLGSLPDDEYYNAVDKLRAHFALDALLGNRDVVGEHQENVLVDPQGEIWRANQSGALRYYANGYQKDFTDQIVPELFHLRNHTKTPGGTGIYDLLRNDEIAAQIEELQRHRSEILAVVPPDLRPIISKRLDWMAWHFGVATDAGKPPAPDLQDPHVEFSAAAHPGLTLNGVPFEPIEDPDVYQDWKDIAEPPMPENPIIKDKRTGKDRPMRLASGLVLVEPDGRIWFTKPSLGFGKVTHALSRGGVEKDLTPQQNAIKEATEEMGLQAEITGVIGDFMHTHNHARFYTGRRTGGEPWDHTWETEGVTLATIEEAEKLLSAPMDVEVLAALKQQIAVNQKKGPSST